MGIEWSPNVFFFTIFFINYFQIPDLLLASYSQNSEGNPNDPQGVVLLWSMSLKTRPEFYCYCQVIIWL